MGRQDLSRLELITIFEVGWNWIFAEYANGSNFKQTDRIISKRIGL